MDSDVTDCSPLVMVVTFRTVRVDLVFIPPLRTVLELRSHSVLPLTAMDLIVCTACKSPSSDDPNPSPPPPRLFILPVVSCPGRGDGEDVGLNVS